MWIKSWLTSRSQSVIIDGECSKSVDVTSGVPQGTVLGPLMFLLFINDMQDDLECTLRLFADDALLYHKITPWLYGLIGGRCCLIPLNATKCLFSVVDPQ